jgi:hypothetical protein
VTEQILASQGGTCTEDDDCDNDDDVDYYDEMNKYKVPFASGTHELLFMFSYHSIHTMKHILPSPLFSFSYSFVDFKHVTSQRPESNDVSIIYHNSIKTDFGISPKHS